MYWSKDLAVGGVSLPDVMHGRNTHIEGHQAGPERLDQYEGDGGVSFSRWEGMCGVRETCGVLADVQLITSLGLKMFYACPTAPQPSRLFLGCTPPVPRCRSPSDGLISGLFAACVVVLHLGVPVHLCGVRLAGSLPEFCFSACEREWGDDDSVFCLPSSAISLSPSLARVSACVCACVSAFSFIFEFCLLRPLFSSPFSSFSQSCAVAVLGGVVVEWYCLLAAVAVVGCRGPGRCVQMRIRRGM